MGVENVTGEGNSFTSISPLWRRGCGGQAKQTTDEGSLQGIAPLKTPRSNSNLLGLCTLKLCATYTACNPAFGYDADSAPRRALTEPSDGVSNGGRDNKNQDLIIYVNDELGLHHSNTYQVLGLLGCGTFGQVMKAVNNHTRDMVAVKVIKNHSAYFNQAKMEIFILKSLQEKCAQDERFRIVHLYDYFMHHDHLCLVFEMLHVNLYELLRSNHHKGLSLTVIRVFLKQLLNALSILQEMHIIHCDLKPENILLCDQSSATIKLIDFGSACFEHQTVYTYIQSRYYRSPEVLCGFPYNSKIDMWSLGCILAELFLGLPLFPGSNDYNQIARIAEMCSYPPAIVLEGGKHSAKYFKRVEQAEAEEEGSVQPADSQSGTSTLKPHPESPKQEAEGQAQPVKSSRPFSFNSMLSLGGGSPAPKEKGKKKKGKEEGDDREMGVEMKTIASSQHAGQAEGPAPKPDAASQHPEEGGPTPAAVPLAAVRAKGSAWAEGPKPGGPFPIIGGWQLKAEEEFCQETGAAKVPWKRYFNYTQLEDLIMHVPYKDQGDDQEKLHRIMFADFLRGLLLPDFRERWTAEQALEHPFVLEEGLQLFNGPGRYHSDVVMVENQRVERARRLAELQRAAAPPPAPTAAAAGAPKPHTRSVPIPRQPGLAAPYPASWGSLIGTSPGYSSSPPNMSAGSSMQPFGSHRIPIQSHSGSPPSPYSRFNSAGGAPNLLVPDDELREHSPDFNLNDSFSISGSYDHALGSGLAHHLAYAQTMGHWPPHPPADGGPMGGPPPGGPPPHPGHGGPSSSSTGPIPMPRRSEAMGMPMIGLSFDQTPTQHLFPPSPIVQSPGSFYGTHMHSGAANQLLGMSPTVSGSPWEPYGAHHQKPFMNPSQQRRSQKQYMASSSSSQRERAMSWSAPKPSSLSQMMMASRGPGGGGGGAPGGGGGAPGGHPNPKPSAGAQHKPGMVGSPADAGRPQQGRNRRKGGGVQPGGPGWGGKAGGAQGTLAPPHDPPDAAWDPFFNDSEF